MLQHAELSNALKAQASGSKLDGVVEPCAKGTLLAQATIEEGATEKVSNSSSSSSWKENMVEGVIAWL